MLISRPYYLDQLVALKDQHLIKVITGIRRCGKSTLMSAYQELLLGMGISSEQIVSVNFEERRHSEYARWQDAYDAIASHISKPLTYYIFLDEVQQVPQFEHLVDALFVLKNVDLYVTGSNAYLLSSELATLLSGRYVPIHLHPFSFAEYVSAKIVLTSLAGTSPPNAPPNHNPNPNLLNSPRKPNQRPNQYPNQHPNRPQNRTLPQSPHRCLSFEIKYIPPKKRLPDSIVRQPF